MNNGEEEMLQSLPNSSIVKGKHKEIEYLITKSPDSYYKKKSKHIIYINFKDKIVYFVTESSDTKGQAKEYIDATVENREPEVETYTVHKKQKH